MFPILLRVAAWVFVGAMMALLALAIIHRDPRMWLVLLASWPAWAWCYWLLRPRRRSDA